MGKLTEQIKGYIYETQDYSRFKMLGGNRFIDHSDKIIESINKVGQLTSPIIVNEKFEIIDGQNRFEAYKKLNLPIQYTVMKGYGISECIAMNSVSKNWTVYDYIHSYADLGNKDYQFLQKMLDKYKPKLTTAVIVSIVAGNIDFFSQKEVRGGAFKVGKEGTAFYDEVLSYLCQFDIKSIRGNASRMYKVLAYCYTVQEIDKKKLVQFFKKYSYLVDAVVDTKQAAEAVEKIYNYKCNRTSYIFISSMYSQYAMERSAINQFTKAQKGHKTAE